MALEYLAKGALDMLATSWLLASGAAGSGIVAGATLVIESGSQDVASSVDWAAVSIESMDVQPGWSGNLGSESNPLKFDVSHTAEDLTAVTSRFRYWASGGFCWFHANNICDILQVGGERGNGNMRVVGGEVKHYQIDNGNCYFGESFTAAAGGIWEIAGGLTRVAKHSGGTDALITVNAVGGTFECARAITTLNNRGARTTLDLKNNSATTINLDAGELVIKSHNATGPTLNARGGTLDLSQCGRPITFTNAILGPITIKGYNPAYHTFTTPQRVGGGPRGLPV